MAHPTQTPPSLLGGSADEIEAQFYEALQRGDVDRLMSLWADDDEIVCVHPGGQRAIGAAAIRANFEVLLAQGGFAVHPEQIHRLQQHGCALHHLVERVGVATAEGPREGWILATNFYVKTAQGWRLASHHASPAAAQPPASGPEAPATLH
ncbi:MAG: nuclear transport factor 2 family protein [Burkholderiales bacterium]|nr:nuclear transport factor 2 family protein [Burkholderiales bacterium]MDE1926448.1 nuclear transport factor 2 family protein [Burkholderiales bacterium]MDE2161080.1 nuclear transport factor 2 family protein [Burkholderiales bacterium]MDE2503016.1 nuclear transport factor 2 family protein [Burkholderiales bacterium]